MFLKDMDIKIDGPIKETEDSHMFSSSRYCRKPLDLEEYGYVEEEYFLTTTSDVYDLVDNKRVVVEKSIPVTTRLIIRRKKDENLRKNRVYVDILNASNCYDIEDLWRRSYLYIMENGFSYVGITSKPCNVLSLKNFDYDRYKNLNFSNGKLVSMPVVIDKFHRVSGCEEGLIWDVLTKLGLWIKNDGKYFFTKEDDIYTYLTGQSQSGMYLNTYVNQFSDIINYYKNDLYDGYVSLVGGGIQRALNQNSTDYKHMGVTNYNTHKVSIPYVELNTEGDFTLFSAFGGLKRGYNSDDENDKRRYYEVAGSAHTDVTSPLVPQNSELDKAKCKRRMLDGEIPENVNDYPLDYIVNGILENLHKWSSENEPAPVFTPMDLKEEFKDRDSFVLDENKNAIGGLLLPFTTVPIGTYIGSTGATDGAIEYFTKDKIKMMYKDFNDYFSKFKNASDVCLNEKIITFNDYKRMLERAKEKWEENYGV